METEITDSKNTVANDVLKLLFALDVGGGLIAVLFGSGHTEVPITVQRLQNAGGWAYWNAWIVVAYFIAALVAWLTNKRGPPAKPAFLCAALFLSSIGFNFAAKPSNPFQSLQGQDQNRNAVRDDLDTFLRKTHPRNPKAKVMFALTASNQAIVIANGNKAGKQL